MSGRGGGAAPIERLDVSAYTVPTDAPEADGTLTWNSTTIVVVEAHAAAHVGLGYSYTHAAAVELVAGPLAEVVRGRDAPDVPAAWHAMLQHTRNLGRPGILASATAAVHTALRDLKARILELPFVSLPGAVRDEVPVYGSGGFFSHPIERLQDQLAAWVRDGISAVKMKVGAHPTDERARVHAARDAIRPNAALLLDANGPYPRRQTLALAEAPVDAGVSWFVEPVPSDDLEGLRLLRDRAPAGIDIPAGPVRHIEYFHDRVRIEALLFDGAPAPRAGRLRPDLTRPGPGLERERRDAERWQGR